MASSRAEKRRARMSSVPRRGARQDLADLVHELGRLDHACCVPPREDECDRRARVDEWKRDAHASVRRGRNALLRMDSLRLPLVGDARIELDDEAPTRGARDAELAV